MISGGSAHLVLRSSVVVLEDLEHFVLRDLSHLHLHLEHLADFFAVLEAVWVPCLGLVPPLPQQSLEVLDRLLELLPQRVGDRTEANSFGVKASEPEVIRDGN